MITGDHALTAAHVASELGIATRPVLLLSAPDKEHADPRWNGVSGGFSTPFVSCGSAACCAKHVRARVRRRLRALRS
jgi:magnesium-transporting ATPase (P-type)